MVTVVTTDENGKIVLTKEELEDLLNKAWNDGFIHNSCHDQVTYIPNNYNGLLTTPNVVYCNNTKMD